MTMRKLFRSLICIVLCICMLPLSIFAQAVNGETKAVEYLSDVKLIYASNAADAQKLLPKGYKLYDSNINEGAKNTDTKVYLCYSTTTDPAEAVTDIRLMNENGGFDRGTFNDKMEQALKAVDAQAEAIYNAIVNEFVPNLNADLPGAKYAYNQLCIFMYDDQTTLGDYIKEGRLTKQDISKMLLVCHNAILTSIFSLIAQGLQRKDGEDWLDKLEQMDPSEYEMNGALQKKYASLINQLQLPLNQFSDQYNIMVYTDYVRETMTAEHMNLYGEDLANEDTVQWWYSLWDILNAHELGGGSGLTAESVLVEMNLGESVANHKICMLIDAMTEGQRTFVSLLGPINFILSDIFTEEERLKAEDGLAALKQENGTVSVWDGVNREIFDHEVGITSVAFDEMLTSNNYDIFTDEKSVLTKSTQDYISIVSYYASIVSGAVSIVTGAAMLAKGYAGTFVVFKLLSHLGVILSKSLVGMIATYAPIVVFALCLLAQLIVWIVNEIQAGKPPAHDRTTIPRYMVDSVTDSDGAQRYEIYKLVSNVQSDEDLKANSALGLGDVKNMCGSDINANKGYHWAALYISKNASVGNPIEADFLTADPLEPVPEGYLPMRHFNKKSEAVSLNAVDSYGGGDKELYLYYKGTKVSENHSVYKYVRNIAVVNVSLLEPNNPDAYRFSAEEALRVARKDLTEIGMYPIDYNFSTDPNMITLIGWCGTDDPDSAVKDIRLVYQSSLPKGSGGTFGSISYGNIGTVNHWSIFLSRGSQNPAPPVTTLKLVEKDADPSKTEGFSINANKKESTLDTNGQADYGIGWEPVNEFAGGNAVPMGNLGVQLYFMPETPFAEGPDYIAGIKYDIYITNYSYHKSGEYREGKQYIENASTIEDCKHTDIWDNDPAAYRQYKTNTFGEFFFSDSIVAHKEEVYEETNDYEKQGHTTTKNTPNCPYNNANGWTALARKTPHSSSAVKYYLTKNPYRAIYGVATRINENDQMRDSFISYAGYGYALSPVEATISLPNLTIVEFGYTEIQESGKAFRDKVTVVEDSYYRNPDGIVVNLDITQTYVDAIDDATWNNIYLLGYNESMTPLTAADFRFSQNLLTEDAYPDNFIQIPYIGNDGTQYSTLAPLNESISANIGKYIDRVNVSLFPTLYGYVRSEVKTGDSTTTYLPGTGKYISKLYLTSKEYIRVYSLLENNAEAECEDVSYQFLKTTLAQMGATSVFSQNIGTDHDSGGNDNANTVYLGYSRTDDPESAIRDIRFYVCNENEKPPQKLEVKINVNGKEQIVTYQLVDGISLTSKANLDCTKMLNGKGIEVWEEVELYTERQAYLYVTYDSTAFPDPITDIQVNVWCTPGTYEPLMSTEGKSFYTVKQESSVNLHITDAWFDDGNSISFKREGNKDCYVSEVTVKNSDNRPKLISELMEAGYSVVNKDMNQNAAGDHIYIGVKYTDNKDEAITNLLTLHQKNPYSSYAVTDERHIYTLCDKVDLNKGAGGDYIYLFYTKDPRAGDPLIDLYASESVKSFTDSQYKHATVQRLWDFKYANLNAGTTFFTSNLYLVMKQATTSGKYISDVYIVHAWSRDSAIEKLQNKGYYEYVDKDLNDGTGSSQYVYLGYKRTDDPNEAIRDIMLVTYGDGDLKTVTIKEHTYTLASTTNLNRHCVATSSDIFLYYTKEKTAGDPITALYCSDTIIENRKDDLGYHQTVRGVGVGAFAGGYLDLNKWAGGDYIYLVAVSQPITTAAGALVAEGSVIALVTFGSIMICAAAGVAVYHKRKKRKISKTNETSINES